MSRRYVTCLILNLLTLSCRKAHVQVTMLSIWLIQSCLKGLQPQAWAQSTVLIITWNGQMELEICKRQEVCCFFYVLIPCHISSHTQQIYQHGLLVFFNLMWYTTPNVKCVIWYCMPMAQKALDVDEVLSSSLQFGPLHKNYLLLCTKVSPPCAHHKVSDPFLFQFHMFCWPHGWWGPRERVVKH